MRTKRLLHFHIMVALIGLMTLAASCKSNQQVVTDKTLDSSQFVTLTDVIPDAILEIRYYSTYNFVGARIDGYLERLSPSNGR